MVSTSYESYDQCGVSVLTCAAALSRVPVCPLAWAGPASRPVPAARHPAMAASPQLLLTLTLGSSILTWILR